MGVTPAVFRTYPWLCTPGRTSGDTSGARDEPRFQMHARQALNPLHYIIPTPSFELVFTGFTALENALVLDFLSHSFVNL